MSKLIFHTEILGSLLRNFHCNCFHKYYSFELKFSMKIYLRERSKNSIISISWRLHKVGKHTFLLYNWQQGKIMSRTICVFLFNELQIYVYGLLALTFVFSNKLSK